MLTPSSNTVLEPVTAAIVQALPEVTVHFSRFRVTKIGLEEDALAQFELQPLLEAARLLADARVHVIAWNGTSAGWLGLTSDRVLCREITRSTDIPAVTSVLALIEVMQTHGLHNYALVTPYTRDVQRKIVDTLAEEGLECLAESHFGITENFAFAEVPTDTITAAVRDVAVAKPQAIVTFCTNLLAAPLVAGLEEEIGIPIYDTTALAAWKSLEVAGVDTSCVQGWGSLFGGTVTGSSRGTDGETLQGISSRQHAKPGS
jgi:maleate isomerase